MSEVGELLQNHWAMDSRAAEYLASDLSSQEEDIISAHVADIPAAALKMRDSNRQEFADVILGRSTKFLCGAGPCSQDRELDQQLVNQVALALTEQYGDMVLPLARINGAKPRSGGKPIEDGGDWTGLYHSMRTGDRKHLFDTYLESLDSGIACITEITNPNQLGALAPFLSGFWLGARDMPSTGLRTMTSAFHLPALIKNSKDGKASTVKAALENIARSSSDNSDSGLDMGTIASSPTSRGVSTGILPIGEGNSVTAIISRGYAVDRRGVLAEEREKAGIDHISVMNQLAAEMGRPNVLDGSHDAPKMFNIAADDPGRFAKVMEKITEKILSGEIQNPDVIRGVLVEVGSDVGRTDPNWVINEHTVSQLGDIIMGLTSAVVLAA